MGVIVIIAVLMAILLPALNSAVKFANQAKTRSEIASLQAAVQSFQSKFGVDFIPSRIKLCKYYSSYVLTNQLDKDSVLYMTKVFPRLMYNSGQATAPSAYGPWAVDNTGTAYSGDTGVNWHPNWSTISDTSTSSAAQATLEGHQALVFFLGGIPSIGTPNSCTGFSTDPTNPANTSTSIDREAQFFEFTSSRLVQWPSNGSSIAGYNGSLFLSYTDSIGNPPTSVSPSGPRPYAFFSFYGQPNGYLRYSSLGSDNGTLGLSAYSISGTSPTQYMNPNSFQIICAGYDGQFGPGGGWTPTGGLTGIGADDLANFAAGPLKAGQ
jgi:hypothetical protein